MATALLLRDYRPRSQLVVPEHRVEYPRFPVVDVHNHLPMHERAVGDVKELVALMDHVGVRTVVNLSGGSGPILERNLAELDRAYLDRFATFCNVHWGGVGRKGWLTDTLDQLEADVRAGAKGLKVFKQLGLGWRDVQGHLIMPDDSRIGPVWEKAAELGIPVLIHSADPVAFFQPLDEHNERWEELQAHPDWHFLGPEYPAFDELIQSLYQMIGEHPRTTFITAHVGCYPENLGFVSEMLEKYANMYTDISARIAELGRAPYSARDWFLKYPDRILFGTDVFPSVGLYRTHYRFLETADEYFPYSLEDEVPGQGRWRIYGLNLPEDVLRKVYYDNVARLLELPPLD